MDSYIAYQKSLVGAVGLGKVLSNRRLGRTALSVLDNTFPNPTAVSINITD